MKDEDRWTGDDLVEWRKRMGLNQTEASIKLGYLHRSSICRYEQGYAKIPKRLQMLCQEMLKLSRKRT